MIAANPLAGYLRWHAQDALLRALTPLIFFLVIAGLQLWSFASSLGLEAMGRPGEAQDIALQIYGGTLWSAMTLGAVLLASGLPATDRERQYFRFLFAKPVVAWTFYLQQFLVGLVLFVLAMALVPIGFSAVVTDVPVMAVVKSAFVFALLFGSLVSLCGALVLRDGVAFVLVAAVSTVLQQLDRARQLPAWLAQVADLLPPFVAADNARSTWLAGQSVATSDMVHVIGYSIGMLAAALFLVRRLPLARS